MSGVRQKEGSAQRGLSLLIPFRCKRYMLDAMLQMLHSDLSAWPPDRHKLVYPLQPHQSVGARGSMSSRSPRPSAALSER